MMIEVGKSKRQGGLSGQIPKEDPMLQLSPKGIFYRIPSSLGGE